jgi:hypothetical protein
MDGSNVNTNSGVNPRNSKKKPLSVGIYNWIYIYILLNIIDLSSIVHQWDYMSWIIMGYTLDYISS